ncbi:hypothetical protein PM082_004095 [Marasmius tenuissimus]|nr:hypothetical protein PM082_004095 [Marasmius tenuissimus]
MLVGHDPKLRSMTAMDDGFRIMAIIILAVAHVWGRALTLGSDERRVQVECRGNVRNDLQAKSSVYTSSGHGSFMSSHSPNHPSRPSFAISLRHFLHVSLHSHISPFSRLEYLPKRGAHPSALLRKSSIEASIFQSTC